MLSRSGLFICSEGVHENECWTDDKPPNLLTTLSVYRRHAALTVARSNLSILAIEDMDEPAKDVDLDVEGLKRVFAWLFNFSAAGIPAPSSIAQYFWTVPTQLENEYWSIEPYQVFQSLLAFPFWQFNPNNFGNVHLDTYNIVKGLPPDFYTTASIGEPYDTVLVDR